MSPRIPFVNVRSIDPSVMLNARQISPKISERSVYPSARLRAGNSWKITTRRVVRIKKKKLRLVPVVVARHLEFTDINLRGNLNRETNLTVNQTENISISLRRRTRSLRRSTAVTRSDASRRRKVRISRTWLALPCIYIYISARIHTRIDRMPKRARGESTYRGCPRYTT